VAQQTAFLQVLLHVRFYTSTAAQIRSPFLWNITLGHCNTFGNATATLPRKAWSQTSSAAVPYARKAVTPMLFHVSAKHKILCHFSALYSWVYYRIRNCHRNLWAKDFLHFCRFCSIKVCFLTGFGKFSNS
jgi:hypothetical protein